MSKSSCNNQSSSRWCDTLDLSTESRRLELRPNGEEAPVRRTKTLLTILVACTVLPALLSPVPAQATAVAADSQARAASFTKTATTVHRQIDRLSRRASTTPHSAWLRRHLVRTDRRVTSLTRSVKG